MREIKGRMISTTALAVIMAAGLLSPGVGKAGQAGRDVRMAANACRANPDAEKKGGNPCAAGKFCNPCAAKKACNPCNPCTSADVAMECIIPRLVAKSRRANPRAVKKPCYPCKPCAAEKSCSPCGVGKSCNPCAVKKACNPCAVGSKEPPKLSDAEAIAAYECISPYMAKAYRKSCHPAAVSYRKWTRFSRLSYPAEAHGVRFMNNYADEAARVDYGKWEAAGAMPSGSVLAKDSFIVGDDGRISVGPLFMMAKGEAGSNTAMRDWQYTMIMPSGSMRQDAAIQKFCNDCHRRAGAEDDYLMFVPLPFRISTETGK